MHNRAIVHAHLAHGLPSKARGALRTLPAPITDTAALESAAQILSRGAGLGLDTEFMRERTYYAQLCLLQLASPDLAVCIDPLAVGSLDALRPLMASTGPCKIIHAARQDLEVLAPVVGTVANIFDTQVAAALVGFPAQVGYAELVREVLGIQLHKSQTRTDWSRRPLSAAQLEYALDDVLHLPPLRERLGERLESLGRRTWFEEEMAQIGNDTFVNNPEQAWLRIKAFADLDPDRQRLARSLAAWREQRAIDSNRPRGWILPDAALRDLVFQVPRDRAALGRLGELPEGIRDNSGAKLLELVHAAAVPQPAAPLPQRRRPDPAQLEIVQRLADITRRVSGELGLAPELLATRRDIERLAGGQRDGALLEGWRRAAIGAELLKAL
jgi:ribonuclease D